VERTGILLAVVVALCWGGADIVATLAARRQGALTTTSISLVVSATMLVFFGLLAFSQLALSLSTFIESIGIGFLTGLMAAIGYFSLYRGLELGPLAIVSPVAAADGAVGAVLAVFLLHEGLSSWQVIMLVLIFLGILCASTNLAEVRGIVQNSGLRGLVAGGVRWGLLAMMTFGVMLFGIGLAAGKWGWYIPIFWTRTFAAFVLVLFFIPWRQLRSQDSGGEVSTRERKPVSARVLGISLAVIVGVLETAGLLLYSFDTQLASTGLASAISSSWGIIPLLAGITIFRERPASYQLVGVLLVLSGLFLLAIKPA
jgi:drug/metabolite transporter (DMT)-like permease